MPLDNKGKFHNSIQRAMASNKAQTGVASREARGARVIAGLGKNGGTEDTASAHQNGGHTIHPNGDGTFYSVSADGERMDHPSAGHAAVHFLSKHGEDGKHMAVSSDGYEHTSHHAESGAEVQGPHSHDNIEALKEHMNQFFDEEAAEKSAEYGMATGRLKDVY